MRLISRLSVTVLLAWGLPVNAQIVHIAPHYTPNISDEDEAIVLDVEDTTDIVTSIAVADGTIYVVHADKPQDELPIGNRTLGELRDYLDAKYPDWSVTLMGRPNLPARYLADQQRTSTQDSTRVVLTLSDGGAPVVNASVGLLYTLNETSAEAAGRGTLLGGAGFQVDLDGAFSAWHGGVSSEGVLRLRAGIVSDDVIPQESPEAAPAFSDAVVLADQVALGLQLDMLWSQGYGRLVVTPEIGVVWSDPTPFDFNAVRGVLDGDPDVAPDTASLRRVLDGVEPLRYMSLNVGAQFNRGAGVNYYFSFGLGSNERLQRGLTFSPTDSDDPSSEPELTPIIAGESRLEWLARAGFRWGGVLDLRIDALGAVGGGRETSEPFLRLMIARPFSFGSS